VSLIQTIGRAARNLNGRVLLYADRVTDSMKRAIEETNRRREVQRRYNQEHGITPQTVKRNISDLGMAVYEADYVTVPVAADGAEYQPEQIPGIVAELEGEMKKASQELEFERAAKLRDRIQGLKDLQLGVHRNTSGMKGMLGSGAVTSVEAAGQLRARKGAMKRKRR